MAVGPASSATPISLNGGGAAIGIAIVSLKAAFGATVAGLWRVAVKTNRLRPGWCGVVSGRSRSCSRAISLANASLRASTDAARSIGSAISRRVPEEAAA